MFSEEKEKTEKFLPLKDKAVKSYSVCHGIET